MKSRNDIRNQQGLTIIEMMIAITMGLLIMLMLTNMLLSGKAGYIVQDQNVGLQETGRYATELLSRAIRQAGYSHIGPNIQVSSIELSANIDGYDAMTLKKNTEGLTSPSTTDVVNGSDVLALRFFGDDVDGSGAIVNCAGLSVPALTSADNAEDGRGWSIFFVAKDSAGEPELRCKYKTQNGWNADAIARGVESFQVLYGIDTHDDDAPDRFVSATGVDAMDTALALTGSNAVDRLEDLKRKTHWKKVRSVRFALLVRGSQKARDDVVMDEYHLFGAEYSRSHAVNDKGVTLTGQKFPETTREYIRKIFSQTIQLRNDAAGLDA